MNHLLLTSTKKLFANKFASLTTDTTTIIISGERRGEAGEGHEGPLRWAPKGGEPKIGRFFPSAATIFFLSPLS